MINRFRRALARHANNYKGWSTSRKIIVIESDDWGSICMPSAEIKKKLIHQNYGIEKCPYASFDSLASEEDLQLLFSVLNEFRDRKGTPPVITANTVTANPDFEKIMQSDFEEYAYEPFSETLKRYPEHKHSVDLWKEGMKEGLFFPQFHGREHINVMLWLEELRNKTSEYRKVFSDEVTWLGPGKTRAGEISIRAAFDTNLPKDYGYHSDVLADGFKLFEKLFGYKSKSFIANNFIYHPSLNQTLKDHGVEYIQGMKYQKLPLEGNRKRELLRHNTGEVNQYGQHYLVRNCVFEPSQYSPDFDNVGECMRGIKNAFFWQKPAIITSHRLNFIGYIDPVNREGNLKQLHELLKAILAEWPDAEFLSSVALGDLISQENTRINL